MWDLKFSKTQTQTCSWKLIRYTYTNGGGFFIGVANQDFDDYNSYLGDYPDAIGLELESNAKYFYHWNTRTTYSTSITDFREAVVGV